MSIPADPPPSPVAGATLAVHAATAPGRLALVATDGSEAAIAAARAALDLMRPDLAIVLITVMEPEYDPSEDEGGFEGPVMTQHEADEQHREAVAASTAALATTATAIDPSAPTEIITSPQRPADAIVTLAKDRDAALIVVGHEQHGLLRELFTASVAERVVRKAPCPVLVVPSPT